MSSYKIFLLLVGCVVSSQLYAGKNAKAKWQALAAKTQAANNAYYDQRAQYDAYQQRQLGASAQQHGTTVYQCPDCFQQHERNVTRCSVQITPANGRGVPYRGYK